MKIIQKKFSRAAGWENIRADDFDPALCNLVLVFGSREVLSREFAFESIRKDYPLAHIVSNSTAGEIIDTQVNDNTISLTAVWFERTDIKVSCEDIEKVENSFNAGKNLADLLDHSELKHVICS